MKNVLSDLSSLPIFVLSFLFYSSTIVGVDGFVPLKPTRTAATTRTTTRTSSRLYYEIQRDSSNVWSVLTTTEKWICQTLADAAQTPGIKKGRTNHQKGKGDKDDDNNKKKNTNTNPFSRKEVHYVCETSNNVAIIVASIFRNIKEAREIGEAHGHGHDQDHDHDHDHDHDQNQNHDQKRRPRRLSPSSSLRQTLIVVIPANEELNNDFQIFNDLFDSINQARRVARDYVTDHSLEGSNETTENNDVSVRCAHLHPKYAEQTPEQELQEMKQDDLKGEIDVNLREYKKHKILARRSPYPSIVIEILAMTMPAVNESEDSRTTENDDDTDSIPSSLSSSLSSSTSPSSFDSNDDDDDGDGDNMKIDSKYLQQLEALFSKSSLNNNDDTTTTTSSSNNNNNNKGDDFYDSIGSHIEEISAIPTVTTPLTLAQNWIETNDHAVSLIVGGGGGTTHNCAACTVSNATHVDEAYEFVFTNLGMQASKYLETNTDTEKQVASDGDGDSDGDSDGGAQKRQYLVMPHFLSHSATSLEQFIQQTKHIIQTLPLVVNGSEGGDGDIHSSSSNNKNEKGVVDISCFHPEHIDEEKRCPIPVIVLQWKE